MPKKPPDAPEAPPAPKCKNCKKPFQPSRDWQRFCNDQCRLDFHHHGRLTLAKMAEIFRKEARRMMAADLAAIKAELQQLRTELKQMKENHT